MKLEIKKGTVSRPQRIVVYAPEGLGKSTLCSVLPDPLFFDYEKGTHHLNASRLEPKTLKETEEALKELIRDNMGYKTLVIDTIDWLEELVIQDICATANKKSVEDFGYGKGYVILAERINELLSLLNDVAKTMDVVLLAHSHVKKFELPDSAGAFDRYELKLTKGVGPLIKEWCDALLFANWKTKLRERDDGGDKTTFKGLGGKERMLYASHSAAWDGKNRHGLKDEQPWTTPEDGAAIVRRCLGNGATATTTETSGVAPINTAVSKAEDTIPMGDHPLKAIVGDNEGAVNAYLVSRKVITAGQTYRDVKPEFVAKVQKAPGPFMAQALKGTEVAA